jgi:hypothetical protein
MQQNHPPRLSWLYLLHSFNIVRVQTGLKHLIIPFPVVLLHQLRDPPDTVPSFS